MRIQAYTEYVPMQHNKAYTKPSCHTSFKGENDSLESIERGYTPTEIELAGKFLCMKSIDKYIQDNMSSVWLIDTVDNALELLGKYRAYEITQAKKLKDFSEQVNNLGRKQTQIINRNKEIYGELEKVGIQNAIDKIKLNKILTQEKRKRQVFQELNEKYIALQKLEQKSFPNAIMIKGMDNKEEQKEVIEYLKKNNCEVYILNFDHIPCEIAHKEISACVKKIKNSGNHSIIVIENFDKYTIPVEENFSFINKLKGFLCACSKKDNTTILVFESNEERLDENIIGKHRFQKEIDVRNYKTDDFCEFTPKYDGYTLIYDDNEDSQVDLYLANYGTKKSTLWIDSDDSKKITAALNRVDKIKKLPPFKEILFAQFPEPDSTISGYKYYPQNHLTNDYKNIFECYIG